MIQPLPTLLARAKRSRRPLLLCEISSIEQAEGCLAAAAAKKSSLALTVSSGTLDQLVVAEALLPLVELLAQAATEAVAIEMRLGSPLTNIENSFPIHTCLTLPVNTRPKSQGRTLAATCTSVGDALAADDCFQILRLPAELSKSGLKEVLTQLKRPAVLEEASFSPARLKAIVLTGIAGITLASQLDASFTAGVRTALRNRELVSPSGYLHRGKKAVFERVFNYLTYIET